MKKTLFSLFGAATLMLAITSCGPKGPTPEQIEAAKQDSIMKAQKLADSTAAVAAAALVKAKEDSIAAAKPAKAVPVEKAGKGEAKPATKKAPAKAVKPAKPAKATEAPKKEEPKPTTIGNGKPSMEGTKKTDGTIGNGKPSMEGPKSESSSKPAGQDRKSTRLNSSHDLASRMPSSA